MKTLLFFGGFCCLLSIVPWAFGLLFDDQKGGAPILPESCSTWDGSAS
jgi:hypothetical protein